MTAKQHSQCLNIFILKHIFTSIQSPLIKPTIGHFTILYLIFLFKSIIAKWTLLILSIRQFSIKSVLRFYNQIKYWSTKRQLCKKISVPLFLMIRLSSLNHFKMLQCILYRFHFLRCRMFPRLFQFFHRIMNIIHRQAQFSLHLCDVCGMYLEAIFRFYVFLNHLVGHALFRLVRNGSLSNIILSSGTFPSHW